MHVAQSQVCDVSSSLVDLYGNLMISPTFETTRMAFNNLNLAPISGREPQERTLPKEE